jgi:DNA-binding transcriptional LysR family regulator
MRGTEFAELRAFAAVAEQGNFARAASQLRLSPSTLSQIIRGLEARIGVRLLNRTTRSLSLTPAGERLLARFKPAMAEMDAAVEDARALQGKPAGLVRLHSSRSAARQFIEPVLGSFHATYPEIVLDLTVDDAVINIVEAGYDAGMRLGELLDNDMVAVKLGREIRQLAVASPAYLARHGTPKVPADLLNHRCINWRQPGSRGLYNWEFFEDGHWIAVAAEGPLIVSHREYAVEAALQDVGIVFWSDNQLRPLIESGQLVPVLAEYSAPFPGWHLYYPRQRYMPTALRAFIDFMRERHQTPA